MGGLPGWGAAAAYGAKLLSGVMDYFNGLAADRRKENDQNVGKKLQTAEDLQATVTAAKETRKDENNIHALSDDELANELRGDGKGTAG